MLNTNHFVSCWFPFMQVNLMGFLLSLKFSSSVTWRASKQGYISVHILSFQGQWCIAWKWEFYEVQKCYSLGENSGFFCDQISFELEAKYNLERKTMEFENTFLSKLPKLFMLGRNFILTSFHSKIKVHIPLQVKSFEKYRNKPCLFSISSDSIFNHLFI